MSSSFERLCCREGFASPRETPLFWVADLQVIEAQAKACLLPDDLMQRAGVAVARLALSIAPHAQRIWIPCGPGNNGGDGLEAAVALRAMGKQPIITLLPSETTRSSDAASALKRAKALNVMFEEQTPENIDLCIDALFGIGKQRAFDALCVSWINAINHLHVPVLAIDIPTGLSPDSGMRAEHCVRASHTLTLLAAKPGLFMGAGRDACGDIWLHSLGVEVPANNCARLFAPQGENFRLHNSHKGSYGDVAIIGGARGMGGAAVLAAEAALFSGAGRVYVGMLYEKEILGHAIRPELMLREVASLPYESMVVVAGCGGGKAIAAELNTIIARASRLVLDADALNAVATHPELELLVAQRPAGTTVMTPHPLEAARLLATTVTSVQENRLRTATLISERFHCTVVLKGSGTVIACTTATPCVNLTGDASLATAGTGDVLAGMIGARIAHGNTAFDAACDAVYHHGKAATTSHLKILTAQELLKTL